MNDFYTEQLVKRQPTATVMAAKAGLIGLTVFAVIGAFLVPIVFIVLLAAIIADIFFLPRLNVEYEYLYVNGDLDIDIIMNKQKRKKKFTMNINEMEMIAPAGAGEIKNFQTAKTYDFTSGVADSKKYEMVIIESGQKVRVLFEPNQTILDGMRMLVPRKVII